MLGARCVLALALLAEAFATEYDLQYEAVMVKGEVGAPAEPRGPYYIPDGQCSALIAGDQINCGSQAPSMLKVSVRDALQPEVRIDGGLRRAVVYRRPGPSGACAGLAGIELRVGCAGAGDRHRRDARSARPLPPAAPAPAPALQA